MTERFVARISTVNFSAIMTAFFRNIGMIDSSSELVVHDVVVDDDDVMIEAEKTSENIQ